MLTSLLTARIEKGSNPRLATSPPISTPKTAKNEPLALHGKRIVFLFEVLILGGAERQGLLLAKHLKENEGAEVEVWGFVHPESAAALCEEYGIPWRIVPHPWKGGRFKIVRSLARLTWVLRRAKPDILLPYVIQTNIACGLTWRLTGAKFCLWNQRDAGINPLGLNLARRAARHIRLFAANSPSSMDYLVNELQVQPHRITLINNGVVLRPPEADRAAWRKRLGLSPDDLAACMVANIHGNKDHATLIRAWREVVDRSPPTIRPPILLLAGYPYQISDVLKLTCDLGLNRVVHFLGPVRDISGLLNAVDLGVFSSLAEGCPNGVLEGMASGLAVAATDIPGIRHAVGPEGREFLAPAGDASALAKHILALVKNPELRSRMGAINRHRIETEFSPRQMCEKMTGLIVAGLNRSLSPTP